MVKPLTEEEVFSNDIDPLEAIAAIRREEGASEESLEELKHSSSVEEAVTPEPEPDGQDEISEFDDKDSTDDEPKPEVAEETTAPEPDETPGDKVGDEETEPKTEVEEVDLPKSFKTFKANGQKFEFSQDEINEQFETVFGKAMNYTQKMQQIAPYRKMISAIESENITQEALNVAIDALKGDAGALRELINASDIDPYELSKNDEGEAYSPKEYGKSNQLLDIEDVTSTIRSDKEFAITADVVDNQWDQPSRDALANNPSMIAALHDDIKTGVYDKVAPAAMKMKLYDGNVKSDIEYYILAGREVLKSDQSSKAEETVQQLNQKTQEAESEFDKASSEAERKRSARSTQNREDRKGVIDYLDDDDEAYDAWYKSVMSKA